MEAQSRSKPGRPPHPFGPSPSGWAWSPRLPLAWRGLSESPAHQGSEAGRCRAQRPGLTSLAGPCATQGWWGFPRTLPPTPGPAGKCNLVTQSWGSRLRAVKFLEGPPLPTLGHRVPDGEFCGCRAGVPWAATKVFLAPGAPTTPLSWKLHTGHWPQVLQGPTRRLQPPIQRNKRGLPCSLGASDQSRCWPAPSPCSSCQAEDVSSRLGSAPVGTVPLGAFSALAGSQVPYWSFNK